MSAGSVPHPHAPCARARAWSSLRLDDELSQLESRLLEVHLAGCADCRAYATRLRSTAELLRAAPVEAPSRRFEAPARPPAFPRRRVVAVAAAAALALGSIVGSLERPSKPTPAPSPELSFLSDDVTQLRRLPRPGQPPVSRPPAESTLLHGRSV